MGNLARKLYRLLKAMIETWEAGARILRQHCPPADDVSIVVHDGFAGMFAELQRQDRLAVFIGDKPTASDDSEPLIR